MTRGYMSSRVRKTTKAKKGYLHPTSGKEFALSEENVWYTRNYLRGSRSAWVPVDGNATPNLTNYVVTSIDGFRLPKSDTLEPIKTVPRDRLGS